MDQIGKTKTLLLATGNCWVCGELALIQLRELNPPQVTKAQQNPVLILLLVYINKREHPSCQPPCPDLFIPEFFKIPKSPTHWAAIS